MDRKLFLFLSYAHEDRELCAELKTHLAVLQQDGIVEGWNDRDILPGAAWETEIKTHLERADIILLLVSVHFRASTYCSLELGWAMERAARGKAVIVPVILRPVDWEDAPFHHFQALPAEGRPVVKWGNRDEAYVDVVRGIRKLSERASQAQPHSLPLPNASQSPPLPETEQDRVLDAAMAAKVPMGKPADLAVMVRGVDSAGLKAVLVVEQEYSGRPEDVRSKPFRVEFPLYATGKLGPAVLTLKLEGPDFDPPSQSKMLSVPPRGDSDVCVFFVTPLFTGELALNLEVYAGPGQQASRTMRILSEASDRVVVGGRILVSVPISTVADPARAQVMTMPAAKAAPPPAPAPPPTVRMGSAKTPDLNATGEFPPVTQPQTARDWSPHGPAQAPVEITGPVAMRAPAAKARRSFAKPAVAAAALVLVSSAGLYYMRLSSGSSSAPAVMASNGLAKLAKEAADPPAVEVAAVKPPEGESSPGNWQASYNVGVSALKQDQPSQAVASLEAAAQAAPTEPLPVMALANARLSLADRANGAEKHALIAKAAEAASQAVSLEPSAENFLTQGLTYQKSARLAEAEAALRKSVELDPANPTAWYALGLVLQDSNKPGDAQSALARAVELDPKNDSARLLLAALLAPNNAVEAKKHVAVLAKDKLTGYKAKIAEKLSVQLAH